VVRVLTRGGHVVVVHAWRDAKAMRAPPLHAMLEAEGQQNPAPGLHTGNSCGTWGQHTSSGAMGRGQCTSPPQLLQVTRMRLAVGQYSSVCSHGLEGYGVQTPLGTILASTKNGQPTVLCNCTAQPSAAANNTTLMSDITPTDPAKGPTATATRQRTAVNSRAQIARDDTNSPAVCHANVYTTNHTFPMTTPFSTAECNHTSKKPGTAIRLPQPNCPTCPQQRHLGGQATSTNCKPNKIETRRWQTTVRSQPENTAALMWSTAAPLLMYTIVLVLLMCVQHQNRQATIDEPCRRRKNARRRMTAAGSPVRTGAAIGKFEQSQCWNSLTT
jgi:hypothetical protein